METRPRHSPAATVWLLLTSALGCSAELGGAGGDPLSDVGMDPPPTSGSSDVASASAATPLVRRLTPSELSYTLTDVLDLQPTAAELAFVPADRPLEGFGNIAATQTTSPEHVLGYARLAGALAARANLDALSMRLGACEDRAPSCRDPFIQRLGEVLFRGPLSTEETARFAVVFDAAGAAVDEVPALGETEAVEAGGRAVLRAMLQSPRFLYRIENERADTVGLEPGAERFVGGREMAVRLSYLLGATAPDALLLAAAERGALDTVEGIRAEVTRAFEAPDRLRRVTDRYLLDWAKLESIPDDGGLRAELLTSATHTYGELLFTAGLGPVAALSAARFWLGPSVATDQGFTPLGDSIAEYPLTEQDGRVGLLAHPGIVAGMTNADGGEIVARGLFLQSRLFCQETPSPPAAALTAIEEFLEEQSETASHREIAEARLERSECGTCHGGFDPLAYAFEQLDYQGRSRETDEHGNVLRTDGWIPSRVRLEGEDLPYADLADYTARLAAEPAVSRCITEYHVSYALGRTLEKDESPSVEAIERSFLDSGGSLRALLEAIASDDVFRKMRVE